VTAEERERIRRAVDAAARARLRAEARAFGATSDLLNPLPESLKRRERRARAAAAAGRQGEGPAGWSPNRGTLSRRGYILHVSKEATPKRLIPGPLRSPGAPENLGCPESALT